MSPETAVREQTTTLGVASDDVDARILNEIQREFPLVRRPFADLGARVGIDEHAMLDRVRRLHAGDSPVIRQISAIFDTRKLGYDSMLVAFKVAAERLESAAAELNRNPGISHNYERSGQFNIWFTIAVPADAGGAGCAACMEGWRRALRAASDASALQDWRAARRRARRSIRRACGATEYARRNERRSARGTRVTHADTP
jgi:DNA-binding Lrp family transcriptional regulator